MKANLLFELKTGYLDRQKWDELKKLSKGSYWTPTKDQIWIFAMADLNIVQKCIGEKIELPEKEKPRMVIEEIDIHGWKGKSGAKIEEMFPGGFQMVYKVTEHRRQKRTGEVVEAVHYIPRQNVEVLWKLIEERTPYRGEITYKHLVSALIEHYGLEGEVDLDSWSGGKNRARHYFPKQYYCEKILEDQGKIVYSEDGSVMRAM